MTTRLSDLRRRITKQRKVEMKRLSRKLVSVEELPAPYKKSSLMKLVELRYGKRLENIIFTGTIYEVERKTGVDATTISKWRKLITEAREKEFISQFSKEEVSGYLSNQK